jgi:hypothetical protein
MSNLTEAQDCGAGGRAFTACNYFVKFHKDVLKTLYYATTFYKLYKIATPRVRIQVALEARRRRPLHSGRSGFCLAAASEKAFAHGKRRIKNN